MKKIFLLIAIFFSCCFSSLSYGMENIFYILRGNDPTQITDTQAAIKSLETNYKQINILISQAYQIDSDGVVSGYVDPDIMAFCKAHNIKLMPLITNIKFDKDKVHVFLADPTAQNRAIQFLLNDGKKYHYDGFQFDFEMVPLADRDALTQFYTMASKALHKAGFVVSYAIAPMQSDNPAPSKFLQLVYQHWEGAYDFKALAASSDFVSIMAYNQHGDGTTPGPTASIDWVDSVVKYALQYFPPQEISLGVSTYSTYWYVDSNPDSARPDAVSVRMVGLGYNNINYLLQKYHAKLIWDNDKKINYAMYERNWLYEYMFLEDADSFKAKLDLANQYHLRGISVFRIGLEDPKIWMVLAQSNH